MVPKFVRQNVSLRKLPRRSEAAIQLIEKTEVDVNLFVLRTIKRTGRGLCSAASGLRVVAEKHELRVPIRFPRLLGQELRPRFLRVIERERNEFHERSLGRIASRIRLPDCRGTGVCCTAAKQCEKIGFEDETEDQQNNCAADPDVQAAELEAATPAALIATVFDVLALATV